MTSQCKGCTCCCFKKMKSKRDKDFSCAIKLVILTHVFFFFCVCHGGFFSWVYLIHTQSGRMNDVYVIWILTNFMIDDVASDCCLVASLQRTYSLHGASMQLPVALCLFNSTTFQTIRRPWKFSLTNMLWRYYLGFYCYIF